MPLVGSYADEDDFKTFYAAIEGVNIENPLTVPQERVRQSLIAASNYINSKLAARYAVPLTNWSAEITRVTCAISMHDNLDLIEIRDQTEKRYKAGVLWLQELRNGDADLIDANGAIVPAKTGGGSIPSMALGCL